MALQSPPSRLPPQRRRNIGEPAPARKALGLRLCRRTLRNLGCRHGGQRRPREPRAEPLEDEHPDGAGLAALPALRPRHQVVDRGALGSRDTFEGGPKLRLKPQRRALGAIGDGAKDKS